MVAEIRIYFEGTDALRQGFRRFFGELDSLAGPPKLIAGRGRNQTISDFRRAVKSHTDALNILLIDSEGPDDGRLFESICLPQGIPVQLRGTVFWMVQCMESWFLADKEALGIFFRGGIREAALPRNPRVEEIPKWDVFDGLKAATEGRSEKTKAPHILKLTSPEKVKLAAPNCRRLFEKVPELAFRG